jgi:CDP-glycerol glycerophosphotransferase (TagB/SpsB family)/glycosyltransferase involved in cell wall biosynthesis
VDPSPRLSIVVPAYRVERYLPACLDSVLGEAYADFELIAVDDASPDDCGAIIDDYAARDGRVRPLHLPENGGLGPARNAGVDVARGDYVLFLDSDDLLTFGALPAIAARLAETGDPDLLVYDYVRLAPDGTDVPNDRQGLLRSVGTGVVTIDDAPALLWLLEVAWTKAYRRDFFVGSGLRYPSGYYEDIPVTYPAMLTARRIAVLDRICVRYRLRSADGPGGGESEASILGGRSDRHLELFEQYDRVFRFLEARPELERWWPAVFDRMLGHCWTVLTHPEGRVPVASRKAFFDRLAGDYQRRLPAGGYRPARPRRRVRKVLTAHGAFRTAVTVVAAWRSTAGLARRLRPAVEPARRAALLGYYAAQCLLPVDPQLAVYAASGHRVYAGNPAAVYEKARDLVPETRGVWVVQRSGMATVPPGVEVHPMWSRGHFRAMARARWFVHDTLLGRGLKRRGSVWVETRHGTPIKKMGRDLRGYPAAAGADFRRQARASARWDFAVSSNGYSSQIWRRAYPGEYEILQTGYPRNDRLATATAADVARAKAMVGVGDRPAVLYAPTFRGGPTGASRAGPDPAVLAEAIGEGMVLLVRAHHRLGRPWPASGEGRGARIVDVSSYHPIEELYLAADVLVTDYSSAMVDYAVLDRPIVIWAPDWETYRDDRGVYFDLLAEPPGTVARTDAELAEAFASGRVYGEQAAGLRAAFRARFCPWDDGLAAERVVTRVFGACRRDAAS